LASSNTGSNRFQPIEQCLLAHPVIVVGIPNVRNSPGFPASGLHLPPHRLGPIDIVLRFPAIVQLLFELPGKSFQTLPVHASTAPVGLD
jgi:hypothetical protein